MKKLAFLILTLMAMPMVSQVRPITLQDLVAGPIGRREALLAPDGKHFAVIEKGQVALLPVTGGTASPITSTSGAKSKLSWLGDSQKLAYVSEGNIWIVSTSGGEPKQLTSGPVGPGD